MGNLRRRLARDGIDYRDAVLSGAGGYNHGEVSDFEFRVNTSCHNVEFLVESKILDHGKSWCSFLLLPYHFRCVSPADAADCRLAQGRSKRFHLVVVPVCRDHY